MILKMRLLLSVFTHVLIDTSPSTNSPSDFYLLAVVIAILGILVGVALGYYGFRASSQNIQSPRQPRPAHGETTRAESAERSRLRAIYNIISALTASLNYQRVLDNILDLSTSILGTPNTPNERLVSAVLLFSPNENSQTELIVGTARRFTNADMRIGLPGTSGIFGRAIEEGAPSVTKNISQDPELKRIVALRVCNSAYCYPLRANLETYGVLMFAHPDPEFFTLDRRETLDIIGHQAVTAMQNARLYSDLEQEKERMQSIQEEARKKLARDLHDGPTQSIAAIAMRVNFARRMMDRDAKASAEELFKIEDLARRTTKEIRHMLFTLRPLVLESQGLLAALEAMADKMRETYNQNVIIQADASLIPKIEMGKQSIIFYIAEEAVNNARKHAQSSHIWVRLKSIEEDMIMLEIEDDGVGFNVGAVDAFYEQRGSLGMVNMRERAELINGRLRIESTEGKGTFISVLIPLSETAAEQIRSGDF